VFILDHSTSTAEAATHIGGNAGKGGDLLYRWGNPQNYNRGTANDQTLIGQHDARWIRKGFLNEGAITVFNNRGISNYQSSVELFYPPVDSLGNYSLAPSLPFLPIASSYTYTNGPNGNFYTPVQGGMQALPNGNVLICNSTDKDIFELDGNGNMLWHYQVVGNEKVFKMTRYLESDNEVSGFLNYTSNQTIESPSSLLTLNCNPIVYPFFCFASYAGINELNGTENGTADFESDGQIESSQIIGANGSVDYDSSISILLKVGFEVHSNADFYAIIDGCNDGWGGLN